MALCSLLPSFVANMRIGILFFLLVGQVLAAAITPRDNGTSIVTWDNYSLKIRGERVFIYSGEIHAFRYPGYTSWVDVMQKLKAAGFNAVSTYFFWGLVEAKKGTLRWDSNDFTNPQKFFQAAKDAGLYVIARPGPYINAEVSSGGFPGWLQRVEGNARNSNANYTDAWSGYVKGIFEIIARNQIDHGGPVIMLQLENEYDKATGGEDFEYELQLKSAAEAAGIIVPTIHNGALSKSFGNYFIDNVDVWGYDEYPVTTTVCPGPDSWADTAVQQFQWAMHLQTEYNRGQPMAIFEFEGGFKQAWGSKGYCDAMAGPEFMRMFNKNKFSMATTIFSTYMVWGGTNWGGIASPDVYTSYDFGAMISEERLLREKYYEAKLQGQFLRSSPAFLTSTPQNIDTNAGAFVAESDANLTVTQSSDQVGLKTNFYYVRHTAANSKVDTSYKLTLPTSNGNITIPQLGGSLTLSVRDTKIHVSDYQAGKYTLLYSSAEIMTSLVIDGTTVIVLYGDQGQTHETSILLSKNVEVKSYGDSKDSVVTKFNNSSLVIQYQTTGQTVVKLGNKAILFLLDRATAYQTWPITDSNVLIQGGYLVRGATLSRGILNISGDMENATTLEILAPGKINKVNFNGRAFPTTTSDYGTYLITVTPDLPAVQLPDLKSLQWKSANSLPEISSSYDDSKWVVANLSKTTNPNTPSTPISLYGADYGYHTGHILWRGHFKAAGGEKFIYINVYGGLGFGYSIWDNGLFVSSWTGLGNTGSRAGTFTLNETWTAGDDHVITILQDHSGYDMSWTANTALFKAPRGIFAYNFTGSNGSAVTPENVAWKVQGNLGGEDYVDLVRGPLNEGGLYGERQGWHLPGFPSSNWNSSTPFEGLAKAGVAFYRTEFTLNTPSGTDYPLSINLPAISSSSSKPYRAMVFINGYQFGRYVSSIGPQTKFPIPPSILNRSGGQNTLAVALWALSDSGAALGSLTLELDAEIEYGGPTFKTESAPSYDAKARRGAP